MKGFFLFYEVETSVVEISNYPAENLEEALAPKVAHSRVLFAIGKAWFNTFGLFAALFNVPFTLFNVPFTLFIVPFTVRNTPFTPFNEPFTVFNKPFTIGNELKGVNGRFPSSADLLIP